MRSGRISLSAVLAAAATLAACGSGPSTTAPQTTAAPTSATASSSTSSTTPVPTTTVAPLGTSDNWVLVVDVDDRNRERPNWIVQKVSLDGAVTELFAGSTEAAPAPLDVDPVRNTMLARRLVASTGPEFELLEYDLATGIARVVTTSSGYPYAEYLHDGSGNILVLDETVMLGEDGFVTSSEQFLLLIAPDGSGLAELDRRPVDPGAGIGWLQLPSPEGLRVVLSGMPMRLLSLDGLEVGRFGGPEGMSCGPRRVEGEAMIVVCTDPAGPFSRVWSFPLDGSAPTPLTAAASDGPNDYGSFEVWTLPTGEQFVPRTGDCGSGGVDRMYPDGSRVLSTTVGGSIIGQDGGRLVVTMSGCMGDAARVDSVDPLSGDTVTLVDSRYPLEPNVIGINEHYGIAWVEVDPGG